MSTSNSEPERSGNTNSRSVFVYDTTKQTLKVVKLGDVNVNQGTMHPVPKWVRRIVLHEAPIPGHAPGSRRMIATLNFGNLGFRVNTKRQVGLLGELFIPDTKPYTMEMK